MQLDIEPRLVKPSEELLNKLNEIIEPFIGKVNDSYTRENLIGSVERFLNTELDTKHIVTIIRI